MRLGLDIDGTINADPVFFGSRASTVIKSGGEVHVVTSRSPEARAETVTELRELGIRYSTLHLLPHISAARRSTTRRCWHCFIAMPAVLKRCHFWIETFCDSRLNVVAF